MYFQLKVKIITLMQVELNCMTLEHQLQPDQLKIERLKHVLMDQYCVSLTMSMFPSRKYSILYEPRPNRIIIPLKVLYLKV